MKFNKNQIQFENGLQWKVWRHGTKILPLDLTLRDITDDELKIGCLQVHELYNEIMVDMYVNHTQYEEDDLTWFSHYEGFFDTVLKCKELTVCGERWLIPAGKFKKLEKRLKAYRKLQKFGFSFVVENDMVEITNRKYPLFLETIYRMQPLRHKRNTPMFECDFRVFNKKYVLTFDDIIHSFNDTQREGFSMLYEHAKSVSDKVKIKAFSSKWMIFTYRGNNVAKLTSAPSIDIPYSFDIKDGKHKNRLESFLDVVSQYDKAKTILDVIKQDIHKCKLPGRSCNFIGNGCNGPIKIKIAGEDVSATNCNCNITRGRQYSVQDFEVYKNLIDIRIEQVKDALK
ncbi:MAG: hypothetical protein FWE06_01310 [Oscillospiraceae bacterium]|nr:hypothetical protein [Oscillospiraceae bacterium]